ncbi:MAG: right-handed parallel beta-helix repeat-containing protein, partial [Actinobacteria bacterium]|nr:right-handed parallel beta-helix repeat-containing protein [Actinomycetota bacterium]
LLRNTTNVTVRGGTVERFAAGISIEGGSANTILGVTSQDNSGPCIGEDFSTFATGQYGDGIAVFGSPNNRLINNTIRRNGPFSGIALIANNVFITRAVPPFPSGNILAGNLVENNNTCFADIGIRMEGPGASNTVVRNNTVRNSFQEGIVVHPVNVIDFEPLFRNPPQCQNRGFPSPNLPLCPIQNPLNPTNDNNIVSANRVESNGYGGAEVNAGPNLPNAPSPQVATGLNLLSFCGFGALSEGKGNVVQGNLVTLNAGHGINVGGCPLGQNPAQGTFNGFTNTRVVGNTSFNNNGRQCGIPGGPFFGISPCGTRANIQNFDLHDGNHETTCPVAPPANNATQAARQAAEQRRAFCATQGFPNFAPASGPFLAFRVTQAGGVPCDANIWFGNRYGTAFPPCTTVG